MSLPVLKKSIFYIEVQPINNLVVISSGQQRDSAILIYVSILPHTPLPSRLPHNIEQNSLCYTVGPYLCNPKRKDRENGTETIFKKITEKNIFSSEVKCINPHIKEVQKGYKQNFIYTQQTKIILLLKYQRQKKN